MATRSKLDSYEAFKALRDQLEQTYRQIITDKEDEIRSLKAENSELHAVVSRMCGDVSHIFSNFASGNHKRRF